MTDEHPCRSVIFIMLLCNFIEITRRHGCSPVKLLLIFRTPFLKNTSGGLLQERLMTGFTFFIKVLEISQKVVLRIKGLNIFLIFYGKINTEQLTHFLFVFPVKLMMQASELLDYFHLKVFQ